jgi:hypothetical protein
MGASEVMRQRRLAAVQSEALFETESRAADSLPEPEENLPIRGALAAARRLADAARQPVSPAREPSRGGSARRFRGRPLEWPDACSGPWRPGGQPGAGLVQYVGPVKAGA